MPPVRSTPTTPHDLRNQPAYQPAEAARYLKLPVATLRSWIAGRDYGTTRGPKRFPAIMTPASRRLLQLSFWNLIEAHVLRALRTEHGVPVKAVREALRYAERELRVERLLLRKELAAGGGRLFLDRYRELIELSASGQIAMRQVLETHLRRVEWDEWRFPVRLYPFLSSDTLTEARPIVIDAAVAFGRPIVVSRGVTTAVIAGRIDAGETVEAVAADYDLSLADIEKAILYQRAA
jgi:uncharacterized protein (DUF433 family)